MCKADLVVELSKPHRFCGIKKGRDRKDHLIPTPYGRRVGIILP